jgi:PhzF family phenazine biosynthesis protein
MKTIPLYQVDVFTSELFGGNPAAVCLLEEWLSDERMQAIAAENNLSETAFVVPQGDAYGIRWFTPVLEIRLAGHPTVGAAHVIFSERGDERQRIEFRSPAGVLPVERRDGLLWLDMPAAAREPVAAPEALLSGLGCTPLEVLRDRDFLVRLAGEEEVLAVRPDFRVLSGLDCLGIIVTAPGRQSDFVSRFFAPAAGVDEDPVTGSAHAMLVPYWAERLGKSRLRARQVSRRGGTLVCEAAGERVRVGGQCVTYLRGEIRLPA